MKTELTNTINELKEVVIETKLNITDTQLMDFAVRIFISNNIEKSKTTYKTNKLNNELPKNQQLATDSQIYALKKLKVTIPENLTKLEASKLISRYKNGK